MRRGGGGGGGIQTSDMANFFALTLKLTAAGPGGRRGENVL